MMDLISYSGTGSASDLHPGYKIYTTTNITVGDWKGIRFLKDTVQAITEEQEHQAQMVCSLSVYPIDLGVVNEQQMYEIPVRPPWPDIPVVNALSVEYPNGGETFVAGTSVDIYWGSVGTVGDIKILFSPDNGSDWYTAVSSTANDGMHPWTVPDSISTKCKIQITEALDGNPVDESDSVFSIVPRPVITVTSPNGDETWFVDSSYTITWEITGNDTIVNVSTLRPYDNLIVISDFAISVQFKFTVRKQYGISGRGTVTSLLNSRKILGTVRFYQM